MHHEFARRDNKKSGGGKNEYLGPSNTEEHGRIRWSAASGRGYAVGKEYDL
jgi:hypothetical protein